MKKYPLFFFGALLLAILVAGCSGLFNKNHPATKSPAIMKTPFGYIDNQEVFLYTLTNQNGIEACITNYGAIITKILMPDKDGKFGDIVLGFDSLSDYLENKPYFGAIVGRYANRIAGGCFELEGRTYQLAKNDGNNHLHGGYKGFDKVVWDAVEFQDSLVAGLVLTYLSPDGEEGYPGNLKVQVTYTLNNNNELHILITATTDQTTIINLTNHTYFNLREADTNILGHILSILASEFTDVSNELIPTEILPPVAGTPMDFNTPKQIGIHIRQVPGGYDHNYILTKEPGSLSLAATLFDPSSGREVKIFTTQPGIQLYTGNFLDGSTKGKDGKVYHQHYGLCLETQHYPDSPNHPSFPGTVLKPGEEFREVTVFQFKVVQ